MAFYEHPVTALNGKPASLTDYEGKAALVVNVASKCGLTPQYEGLQKLQDTYAERGFTVLGFPCNQFLDQEPGTADEIQEFCSVNYGVTVPLFSKIDVNGDDRDPLYAELEETPDVADGHTGDIRWNFEKFLVAPGGEVVARFNPMTEPTADEIVAAVEKVLPA